MKKAILITFWSKDNLKSLSKHFNIGKKGNLGISFPNWKQNKLIIGVIAVFSFISCIITQLVQNVVSELNKH